MYTTKQEELPQVDPNYEAARRKTIGPEAAATVHNFYLRLALLGSAVVVLGLAGTICFQSYQLAHVKHSVTVIDPDGRPLSLADGGSTGPLPPRAYSYFLDKFVENYYSRHRFTLRRDYAESLKFFTRQLAEAHEANEDKTHWMETFLSSGDPEVSVVAKDTILPRDLKTSPLRAYVEIERSSVSEGNVLSTERSFVTVDFIVDQKQGNDQNPLGFGILYEPVESTRPGR